jgi:hypothetical protein
VIVTNLAIADDPASPFGIAGVHRHPEEQAALDAILRTPTTLVVFFDELSRPVLRASCRLDERTRSSGLELLAGTGSRFTGPWIPMLGEVLDEIQGMVDPTFAVAPVYSPRSVSIQLSLSDFFSQHITVVGDYESRDVTLDEPDEGYPLEHGTWQLLENMFAGSIFHSPQVANDLSVRELTDILAYCDLGHCFVEAKAMAVLSTAPDRSTQRRAWNIEKQIRKALSQLPGAMRTVADGVPITSKSGDVITMPPSIGPFRNGIIMVSELMPAVDWPTVTAELLEASNDTTMMHVLDLVELRLLVGISKNSSELFFAYLNYRHELMRKHKNALIRMKLDGPPLP